MKKLEKAKAVAQQLADARHEPYMAFKTEMTNRYLVESESFFRSALGQRRYNGVTVEGVWIFPEVQYLQPRRRDTGNH